MSDSRFCCDQMAQQVADKVVRFDERYVQYDLTVRDDGEVLQQIDFCPWCATRLPESLREKWFDELEAMGIDPMRDPIPEPYQSSEWRK